jgi:hypothetical protein
MHSVIRTYSGKGSKEFFDILENRKTEVADLMRSVKGFVSYTLFRDGEGGCSVTVCKDKTGVEESAKVAKEWTTKNAGDTGVSAPRVSEGTVNSTRVSGEDAQYGRPKLLPCSHRRDITLLVACGASPIDPRRCRLRLHRATKAFRSKPGINACRISEARIPRRLSPNGFARFLYRASSPEAAYHPWGEALRVRQVSVPAREGFRTERRGQAWPTWLSPR